MQASGTGRALEWDLPERAGVKDKREREKRKKAVRRTNEDNIAKRKKALRKNEGNIAGILR